MSEDTIEISKRAEEGLRYRLKQYALGRCSEYSDAFVACSKDRLISVIWACRGELNNLNTCLNQFTGNKVMERLKQRWVDSGKSRTPNWAELLKDIEQEG